MKIQKIQFCGMMNTLQKWNELINETLNPSITTGLIFTDEFIQRVLHESKEEQRRVRSLIVQDVLERIKIRDKKQYVRLIQLLLVNLIDKLSDNRPVFKSKKIDRLCQEIEEHLLNLLDFLREYFPEYFNNNQKVPKVFFSKWLPGFQERVIEFKESKHFSCMDDRGLKAVIIKNLLEFGETVPTYNELKYQEEFLVHLTYKLSPDDSIKKTIFFFNYNHRECLDLFCKNLSDSIKKLSSKTEKISALLLEQKKISQLPRFPDLSLLKEMPSMYEQLNSWIEAEILFIQKDTRIPSEPNNQVFVHVPFKGTEIYLLHKAFIDSGGASGETYKSFFEKTASHLTNNNQIGFSTESLQKNSDKINYEVKGNVKRFLQKMIRNIDSY